jgi:hypothetical protein
MSHTRDLSIHLLCYLSGEMLAMQFPPPCLKHASTERTHRLLTESNLNDPHRSALQWL